MKRVRTTTVCLWVLVALAALGIPAAGSVHAQEEAAKPPAEALEPVMPAKLSGFADEGVFLLFKNEECLAQLVYHWTPAGDFAGESHLTIAGQTIDSSIRIDSNASGYWDVITIKSPLGEVLVTRAGETISVKSPDKTETIALKPNTVLFENLTPALMSQAVLCYDQAAGGKQQFPLFIVPAVIMSGSLERTDTVERRVGNRDYTFTRYIYGVPGVDITIWADEAGKLYLADVPAQRAAYVREGFEALRVAASQDPRLSAPQYEVEVETDVMIPMRDGVRLATNMYRPAADGKFPVIFVRTPYKKEISDLDARFYARRGYVAAIQDCRGRFGSEGTWEPFVHEAQDGYDAIEWLAAQPWSSGKVGMIGASYLGWVQWWAASEHPPHLTTIIPNVSPPDPFYNIPYEYGVHFLLGAIWWADVLESEATADLSGRAFHDIGKKKYGKLLRELPVIELDRAVLGQENPYWRKWIEHPVNDEYWERANFLDKLANVRIPVFHQSGWFDGDGIGSKLNYLKMASHGHPYQKLILGPWGHTPEAQRMIGDRDFGAEAIRDLPRAYLRWFDYWLKGIDNGIAREPLVSLFVMGSNRWLEGDAYPLPQTRFTKLYLDSGGNANTSKGDGRLIWVPPNAASPPDHYTYDPGDPTPMPSFYEESEEEEALVRSVEEKKRVQEAHHEQVTATRADILVYATEPLEKPLTIAGPLSAVLYAATSAKDTDWFVRLMEVDEHGKIFQLAEGKIRARYRTSTRRAEFLVPDQTYEYTIDLWQTGITVPAGRRLRVEVASASFPLFSRNLNTGGHNEKDIDFVSAQQVIHHDAARPSHILLPVIPAQNNNQPETGDSKAARR
ncbi:MAG: CocE/NonD family hydrolase [Planctomycetes bacterium]|nr:CocE/NonD family hydrolase [Planctomycetota bacterium]